MTHPEPYWIIPALWLALLGGFLWLSSPRRRRLRAVARPVVLLIIGAAVRARLIK